MTILTTVSPSPGSTRLRPIDARGVTVEGGFWGDRLTINRETTIPHGHEQLQMSGALGNFHHAAQHSGRYIGGLDDAGLVFPFLDSDVYKWLEAVAWELGRADDPGLAAAGAEVIDQVVSAQRDDGYLDTFVQLSGGPPYEDLQWGHELYCIGHLLQAGVAWQRAVGDHTLLSVADRAVGHALEALGEGRREGIGGHPEVEMALVEAFRTTERESYLVFARTLVERRGRGLLGPGRLGSRYWQDHESPRTARSPAGHVVRQMYLDCGVTDVAVETGDPELLAAVVRRWDDMWSTRTYITGALGSRHRDEAFGDRYELPPDRAYAETCAAIGSLMLSWRLLLATGETRFADAFERTVYNAVLPGLSLDGASFFYTNPLRLRDDPITSSVAPGARQAWYPCACCPPNLMRTLSSFEHHIATVDDSGLQLQQFAAGVIETEVGGQQVRLRVETDQPWGGSVAIVMESTPADDWTLSVRLPAWLEAGRARVAGEPMTLDPAARVLVTERTWVPGDRVELDFEMPPRWTLPHPAIDAVRGCAAIERGPLVYCVEQMDLPSEASLDDLEVETDAPLTLARAKDLPDEIPAISVQCRAPVDAAARPPWPYAAMRDARATPGAAVAVTAVPYFAWANRETGPMRVWLPISRN